MRRALAPNFTLDYTGAIDPWIETLRHQGFSALGTEFSNYNPPYLYLLYIGTKLPIHHDLIVDKIIAGSFDLLLAAGVAGIVYRLRGKLFLAAIGAIAALFIPEVFLSSGMWGQADSTYTTFLVWAAFFLLKKQDIGAWVMFAIAFAFKLQGLFFLPWMALAFIFQKHRWRAVGIGVLTLLATYIPALVAGRSVSSLASIYIAQTSAQPELTALAVNLYQWVPSSFFATVYPAGLFFGVGIVAILCPLYLRHGATMTGPWMLRIAAAIGVVVPFVLPEMHDRNFYPGDVFVVLCISVDRRYIVPAVATQFTALCAYSPILRGSQIISFQTASIVQLAAVVMVVVLSFPAAFNPRLVGGDPEAKGIAEGLGDSSISSSLAADATGLVTTVSNAFGVKRPGERWSRTKRRLTRPF